MRKHALKQEVHNMTPNVSEEEAKAVRDKFDATYMKGRGVVTPPTGEIKEIPQEVVDASRIGAAGNLSLIAGNIGRIGGSFINAMKQYWRGFGSKNPSNFKPLITGNKVYDTKSVNEAFKSRFGGPQSTQGPSNVISNATVDRASTMRNIMRGNSGNTPRWAKPVVKK
tara:strand:- start:746 stop:1249 length:504 start_codon:yes stop_codon:yes gene_type:complete